MFSTKTTCGSAHEAAQALKGRRWGGGFQKAKYIINYGIFLKNPPGFPVVSYAATKAIYLPTVQLVGRTSSGQTIEYDEVPMVWTF